MENIKDAIDFANNNSVVFLSTTDANQPRVRGMWMWFADETGFYYHTGTMKSLYKQLCTNPNVEACHHDAKNGIMLRVAGKIEFVNDSALKEKLLNEREWLKTEIQNRNAVGEVVIFRIYTGEAYSWTMENNCHEDKIKRIKF